jgi:hypothetical protein
MAGSREARYKSARDHPPGLPKGFAMVARPLLLATACLALTGCVSAVKTVVTAPVKAVGKVADWSTTSQEESDRNYGKKMREKEAREGKERRKREKECRKNPDACQSYDGYRAGDPD